METMTKTAILGVKDWLFSSIMQWLYWAADWVLQTVGWPGIIAGLAGTLFLLSASVRAVRFLHSPKGLGVSGAITLAGLACTWWFWPEPALAIVDQGPPAIEETKSEPGSPAETVLAAKSADVEAVDAAPVLMASQARPSSSVLDQPFLPILAMVDAGSPGPMPLLPAPHIAPIIKPLPVHTPPAHVKPPHSSTVSRPVGGVAVLPRVSQPHPGGFNGNGPGYANRGGFGHGGGQAGFNHRPNIHEVNNAMAHGFDPYGFSMGGVGGYGQPMHTGGMGQMGGMHPAMGHSGHLGHH